MPMLVSTNAACPASSICARKLLKISGAEPLQEERVGAISTSSTANSSPPRRATKPIFSTAAARRAATMARSSSPWEWPRLSLTCLKPSKSSIIKAQGRVPNAAASRACKALRLGREVRVSQWARCSRCCCARLRVGHVAEQGAEHWLPVLEPQG